MNIYKILVTLLLTAAVFTAHAEKEPFVVAEVDNFKIKLSKDGTGIINNVSCETCNFKTVLLTKNSKAYVHSAENKSGVEVDLQQAKKRAGKFVMVAFNPETREVQTIRWWK